MSRRDFLKRVATSFLFLVWVIIGLSVLYFYPAGSSRKTFRFFPVLSEDELPLRGVKRVDFSHEQSGRKTVYRAFIAALPEGYVAFSPVCSHLGCLVNWDSNRGEFLCPCHGGKYDMRGRVIAGPPPQPLTRLPLEIREGRVFIGIKA